MLNSVRVSLLCLSFLAISGGQPAVSQLSLGESNERIDWSATQDAFRKEKYALALFGFEQFLNDLGPSDMGTDQHIEAMYKRALCAVYLYHPNADHLIGTFVHTFPDSPYAESAHWELADLYYSRRDWDAVIAAFAHVNERKLKPAERLELKFKRGHASFEEGDFDAARVDLFEVAEASGPYQDAARYYFSHIAYLRDQPQVALEGFQSLAEKEDFADLVPIYIAQLLHETERYEDLIGYAPKLFEEGTPLNERKQAEVARLLGDAFYRKQRFEEALPHLEMAWKATPGADRTRDLAYQMGFVRLKASEWRGALNAFSLVTREEDELAQNALYHMANAYLELGDKDKARTAFRQASLLDFDPQIKEDALFSHAKLAFELSYNPLDDAITAFERYLDEFPNSSRRDEAYAFLLEVYMTSKDYTRALQALNRIEEKNARVKRAYQLLAYNRGVELFRANKYPEADRYFEDVRTYPVDAQLAAESHFWQGELRYFLKRYAEATSHYATFHSSPGAFNSDYYDDAEYARGYALFKRKLYVDALSAFRSYLKIDRGDDAKRTLDATLRTGDCFYSNKSFDQAAEAYLTVITAEGEAADYALFQRALCLGYMDDLPGQIAELERLITLHPTSSYLPEAHYEAGRSHIELDQLDAARKQLETLLQNFPQSPKTKYALVDLCLVGYKQGRNEDVLGLWDQIRTQYGNDPIAADAFNVLEPLLIERGLLDDLPSGVGLDGAEIEDRLFEAALGLALDKDCPKALIRLNEYIRQYPEGRHVTEAQYFRGQCALDMEQHSEARQAFDYVLTQPINDFTELSALAAASIAWKAQDIEGSKGYYRTLEAVSVLQDNLLEARIGLMRCHYLLNESEAALAYADQVIADEGTPDDIRRTAHYWRAKLRFDAREWATARPDLESVAAFGGARGAECKFLLAQIAFEEGAFETAELEIFELIDGFAAYEEWKFKGFILLARVYLGMEDFFQARATAQQIVDHVSVDWVVAAAQEVLADIQAAEDAQAETELVPDTLTTPER